MASTTKGKSPTTAGRTNAIVTPTRPSGMRETIESIVVAFVLAFLFKTFEAEAFVIPTGSMAPTLLGRNKSIHCPECGFNFTIGASDEVNSETDYLEPEMRIQSAVCPNCRFKLTGKDQVENLPVFKGDRILVTKFSYEIADPKRWDVGVFKYPEEPKTNYIKRIIGLPNETIQIRQGDVYRQGDRGWEILRKSDPNKQRAIQLTVYDNDHPERPLLDAGWPERWAAVKKADTPDAVAGWSADAEGWSGDSQTRSFHLPPDRSGGAGLRWVRYRNFVPNERNAAWSDVLAGQKPVAPRPELITDFCGYNAYSNSRTISEDLGLYWVGDLTINCRIDARDAKPDAQVVLELNEGARGYRCRVDLASGRATLAWIEPHDRKDPTGEHTLGSATTRFVGDGRHDVTFANVDDRLCLWVDGRLIDFGEAASYAPYGGLLIQRPTDEDLVPVGIAAHGADVTISHLLLQRDLYYRGDFVPPSHNQFDDGAASSPIEEFNGDKTELIRKLDNPAEWFREYEQGLSSRQGGRGAACQFTMGEGEFFMMGDNSPRSKDSRLWSNARRAVHRYAVPRLALVGKAFFVYWPHGIPFLNDGRGYPDGPDSIWNNRLTAPLFYHTEIGPGGPVLDPDYPKLRVPFYPDFARMHRIR